MYIHFRNKSDGDINGTFDVVTSCSIFGKYFLVKYASIFCYYKKQLLTAPGVRRKQKGQGKRGGLMVRASDSGWWFDPHSGRRVVSLSKKHLPSKNYW